MYIYINSQFYEFHIKIQTLRYHIFPYNVQTKCVHLHNKIIPVFPSYIIVIRNLDFIKSISFGLSSYSVVSNSVKMGLHLL